MAVMVFAPQRVAKAVIGAVVADNDTRAVMAVLNMVKEQDLMLSRIEVVLVDRRHAVDVEEPLAPSRCREPWRPAALPWRR